MSAAMLLDRIMNWSAVFWCTNTDQYVSGQEFRDLTAASCTSVDPCGVGEKLPTSEN